MNNPNEKLQKALSTFFFAKLNEFYKKYHLNQDVDISIYTPQEWSETLYLSYDSAQVTWYVKSCRRDRTVYTAWKAHYGFYTHYADIIKELDKLQKEEDSLFRFQQKYEAEHNTPDNFSLQA